jgi:hypothetical protein
MLVDGGTTTAIEMTSVSKCLPKREFCHPGYVAVDVEETASKAIICLLQECVECPMNQRRRHVMERIDPSLNRGQRTVIFVKDPEEVETLHKVRDSSSPVPLHTQISCILRKKRFLEDKICIVISSHSTLTHCTLVYSKSSPKTLKFHSHSVVHILLLCGVCVQISMWTRN